MTCQWKPGWTETRKHFEDWWNRTGLVVSMGAVRHDQPLRPAERPAAFEAVDTRYVNPSRWVQADHYRLACQEFPLDCLPLTDFNTGPGSLALYVGCEPGFSPETVWFEPCWQDEAAPESLPPIQFDPENRWWKLAEQTLREGVARADGQYLVGCPDLVENVDVLSSMRDPQTLMMDFIERPEWVEQKVREINQAWFDVYSRVYEIIAEPDGSSAFSAFMLWGPGKTAKVQCDAAAMFSPEMFRRFVMPSLAEQCQWLDHSMFHLDGTQCICHLDALLEIDALDAVEWTPQAGLPGGGDPQWYDLYRRIKDAGKSVQAIGVSPEQLQPLLDAVGPEGMYVMGWSANDMTDDDRRRLAETVDSYRR